MTLTLHVLGSTGSWPAPDAPTSGYVVADGATRIVVDLGFGTMPRLPAPANVHAVVITHRHPDHCADVLALYHLWAYGDVPMSGVPLIAPRSTIDSLAAFLDAGSGSRLWEVFTPDPVGHGEQRTVGTMSLSFAGVDHSGEALGVRIEAGDRSLFYTGDTGPAGEWWKTVETTDVVLSEATWQGDRDGADLAQHLTAAEAGRIATEIGASRLVLTHLRPGLDPVRSVSEAQTTFPGPVSHADPGLTIEV